MRLISDRWFNLTAGVILFITGAAKVWSALGTVRILNYPDPVFDVSFGHLMFVAGIIELIIASLCLSNKYSRCATVLVAFISTNFLVYRIGLWLADWRRPCRCLGDLTDALHISPEAASFALKVALTYLLIGSYFTLLASWIVNRRKIKLETQSLK
jgi:hypothetical protein